MSIERRDWNSSGLFLFGKKKSYVIMEETNDRNKGWFYEV